MAKTRKPHVYHVHTKSAASFFPPHKLVVRGGTMSIDWTKSPPEVKEPTEEVKQQTNVPDTSDHEKPSGCCGRKK